MNFGALEMGHRKSRRNVSVTSSHVASRNVTQQRWHPACEPHVCLTRAVSLYTNQCTLHHTQNTPGGGGGFPVWVKLPRNESDKPISWRNREYAELYLTHVASLYITLLHPLYFELDSDSLRTGRSGDRIPVWARFSTPVQSCPAAHPASCTMGTGSFSGGGGRKRPGSDADPSPRLVPRSKNKVELYLYSP
jgi:hypothetical protein